jgi:hypothetical protein
VGFESRRVSSAGDRAALARHSLAERRRHLATVPLEPWPQLAPPRTAGLGVARPRRRFARESPYMTDAIGRLTALGRTESDRALLRQALLDLNANDGLATKLAAESMLPDVIAEFIGRLTRAYGSLAAIRDQVVLDIACGSNSSRSPVTGRRTVAFEPWMCRLLAALGARPVGLDIGDLERERFEHHHVDLGVPGALDFLPSASFDAIHESRLFGSPEFRSVYGPASDRVRAEITRQEARLLKPGGILIHSDAYDRAQGRR